MICYLFVGILLYNNTLEVLLTALDELTVSEVCNVERHLEIRDLFAVNGNTALLDCTSCFGTGCTQLSTDKQCKNVSLAVSKISSREFNGRCGTVCIPFRGKTCSRAGRCHR